MRTSAVSLDTTNGIVTGSKTANDRPRLTHH